MCRFDVFMARIREIIIVALQLFCFAIKVNDMNSIVLNSTEYLGEQGRHTYVGFYFMARNFKA
jgi:hypothetical protein